VYLDAVRGGAFVSDPTAQLTKPVLAKDGPSGLFVAVYPEGATKLAATSKTYPPGRSWQKLTGPYVIRGLPSQQAKKLRQNHYLNPDTLDKVSLAAITYQSESGVFEGNLVRFLMRTGWYGKITGEFRKLYKAALRAIDRLDV